LALVFKASEVDIELETYALLRDMGFSSAVIYQFPAADKKPLYNGSRVREIQSDGDKQTLVGAIFTTFSQCH